MPIFSFADEMKQQASNRFRVPLQYFHDRDKKDDPGALVEFGYVDKSPRDLLIEYAAEKRAHDPHYFTESVARRIAQRVDASHDDTMSGGQCQLELPCGRVVQLVALVADCRFENEVQYVSEHLGDDAVVVVSCWVHRPSLEGRSPPADNTQITRERCHMSVVNESQPFDAEHMKRQVQSGLARVMADQRVE